MERGSQNTLYERRKVEIKTGENKQTEVRDKQTAEEELKKNTHREKHRIMKERGQVEKETQPW